VEDNRDILRATQRILESQKDYRILTAVDGEQALSRVRENRPDLVLLDVMIPKIDGIEVLKRLKSDRDTSGVMVILVTGRASLDHRIQGFDAGADDYIPKPYHIPELLARVRSTLRIKHLTDDLEERNRELVRSQRSVLQAKKMATIGLLASGIAHEFNNIMAGISGYAQLARKNPEFRDSLVEIALTQTERATELTQSLSTYNRGCVGHSECDVVEVIENALCLVTKELENTDIRPVKEFEGRPRIQMSPGNFQEVMLNLILNGIQAIEDGAGSVRIRVGPAEDSDGVRIDVSDSGVGISEENQDRIFDPFFTTKGALGGGQRSGTGLGLTVCYNLVHSHGGDIEVSSRPGRGTTFRLTLPRADETVTAQEAPAADPADPPLPDKEVLRILVVDDEKLAREMIRDYLSGHEVETCSKVETALEAYALKPFDYVILDVAIESSLNGFQAFERFSRFQPPPRVIFASGRFPDPAYRSYLQRAHGHLLKPYKFEALLKLLGLPVPASV
jgi:signal transduction histidine kinase